MTIIFNTILGKRIPQLCTCLAQRSQFTINYVSNNELSTEENKFLEKILYKDFELHVDFISKNEEANLIAEVDKVFRRTKYEFDHWDNVSVNNAFKIEHNLFVN